MKPVDYDTLCTLWNATKYALIIIKYDYLRPVHDEQISELYMYTSIWQTPLLAPLNMSSINIYVYTLQYLLPFLNLLCIILSLRSTFVLIRPCILHLPRILIWKKNIAEISHYFITSDKKIGKIIYIFFMNVSLQHLT